jgi:endonuclease/exonuclease/phosphatase family metal-dependent hydrolase
MQLKTQGMRRPIKEGAYMFGKKLLLASLMLASGFIATTALSAENNQDTLRVLSYNINAMPAPIIKNGQPLYEEIARILRQRRSEGTHPQILLLQEAFVGKVSIILENTGYQYVLKGPSKKESSKKGRAHWAQQTRKAYAVSPNPQKFTNSGLYILSDFPIVNAQHKAFDSDMCAGIDCLANKAILYAEIEVPFFATPVGVLNSHFNSRHTAKAPSKTVLKSHYKQTDVLASFLKQLSGNNPLIVAGDFNTKHDKRYRYFRQAISVKDVAEVCFQNEKTCSIEAGTRRDELLYDTNDKHFLGDSTKLEPVLMWRNFTETLDGRPLSDHLGYEVHYQAAGR